MTSMVLVITSYSIHYTKLYDLREGYPLPLLSVPEEDVVRIHGSSGTTGKRKILAYTQKDIESYNFV